MAIHDRSIELSGYRRLQDVERRIWYAPMAIVLAVFGLVGAGVVFRSLSRGIVVAPGHLAVGYAILLGAYGALFAYYQWYRFPRVKCPCCDQLMQPYVADLDDRGGWNILQRLEIGGRCYRRPYDEDDRRPWIRVMVMVRACRECRTFVSCSRLHYETCTEEELTLIAKRISGGVLGA